MKKTLLSQQPYFLHLVPRPHGCEHFDAKRLRLHPVSSVYSSIDTPEHVTGHHVCSLYGAQRVSRARNPPMSDGLLQGTAQFDPKLEQQQQMWCVRSAWRRLCSLSMALAPLCTAQVATRDAAAPSVPVAACTDDAQLFLELSALLMATVVLAVSMRRCASHCRRRRQPLAPPDRPWWTRSITSRFSTSCQLVLKLLLALTLTAWGIAGLLLAGATADDVSHDSLNCYRRTWIVPTAITVSCACLLVTLWLFTQLIADAVRRSVVARPNETPVALRCLRCSCCPFALPRALVLLPLLLLAVLALRSWIAFRPFQPCEQQLATFLAGSAIVFALMATAATFAFVYSSLPGTTCCGWPSRQDAADIDSTSSNLNSNHHAKRRAARFVLALTLGTLAIVGVTWGVLGLSWLQHIQESVPDCSYKTVESFRSTVGEAQIFAAALLVIGVMLLATTMCCRPENFLLATGATPPVDSMMLSPTLSDASRQNPPSSNKREVSSRPQKAPGTPAARSLTKTSAADVV